MKDENKIQEKTECVHATKHRTYTPPRLIPLINDRPLGKSSAGSESGTVGPS